MSNKFIKVIGLIIVVVGSALGIQAAVSSCQAPQTKYDFVVAADGSGDFKTVQEAIDAVPAFRKQNRTTILIRKGTYKEKVVIAPCKINLTLIGEDGAKITYDDFAQKPNRFGEETSTSGSASVYIYAPDFRAENIIFENSAGPVGQAVACFVAGDRCCFCKCKFLGNQDTLYTYGEHCRIYFNQCYIEGTVDYIFGWSTAIFDQCEMHSLTNGYVTAPSTMQGERHGYVFYDCKFTAEPNVTESFLSRPWRPYAQAVFIRCELGKQVPSAGFDPWALEHPEQTVLYAEYESTGPGANPSGRCYFSQQLPDLTGYDMKEILAGDDGWNPVDNDAEILNIKR